MTQPPFDMPTAVNVGVIVCRKKIDNPWQEYRWSLLAVVPGMAPLPDDCKSGRLLKDDGDEQHFHIGNTDIHLYAKETAGYKVNLDGPVPVVYVVLGPGEEKDDPDVVPFLATICPYEAESYTESGEDIVEGVAMPRDILDWVERFMAVHHVEEVFVKRKQKKAYDPRKQGLSAGRGPDRRIAKERG